jgi:archaellum component FlaC
MSAESIDSKLSHLEGAFAQFGKRFDAFERLMTERFGGIDRRFDGIDKRFEAIDRRFDGIDRRFEAIDRRFEGIGRRFDALGQKTDANFRWSVGITLTSFVALSGMMITGFVTVLSRIH